MKIYFYKSYFLKIAQDFITALNVIQLNIAVVGLMKTIYRKIYNALALSIGHQSSIIPSFPFLETFTWLIQYYVTVRHTFYIILIID